MDPAVRRANLLVSGVELDLRREGLLRIGDVKLRVRGETRPCELLEDQGGVGLYAALREDVRAGVFATVEHGGVLRVGADVAWE